MSYGCNGTGLSTDVVKEDECSRGGLELHFHYEIGSLC